MNEPKQGAGGVQRLSAVLQATLSTIAIGVPVLYALGRVYSEAYWAELQMPDFVVSYGVEDYIYLGFMATLNASARAFSSLGSTALRYLLGATGIFAFAAIYSVALDKVLIPALKRGSRHLVAKFSSWKIPHGNTVASGAKFFAGLWALSALLLFLLCVAFFVAALPILGIYKAGKVQAGVDKAKLLAVGDAPTKYGARPILHYRDGMGASKASLLLECADQWCVAYEGGFFVAVKVDAVERIDHCPKHMQLKSGATICEDLVEATQASPAGAGADATP